MATDVRLDLPERAGWRITASAPCVGVGFWATAVCVSTVGAFAGSRVLLVPGAGRFSAVVAAVAWFGAAVAFHLRARRGLTLWYWLTTLLAGVAAQATTGLLGGVAVLLSATLLGAVLCFATAVWWYAERSLGLDAIRGPRWQVFFWLTLVVAIAGGDVLGRVLGRVFAGYGPALAAGAGIAALVLLTRRRRTTPDQAAPRLVAMTVAFWATYVLLQPFGTGVATFAARSRHSGGLGLGTTDTIEFFVLSALSLLGYQAGTRPTHEH